MGNTLSSLNWLYRDRSDSIDDLEDDIYHANPSLRRRVRPSRIYSPLQRLYMPILNRLQLGNYLAKFLPKRISQGPDPVSPSRAVGRQPPMWSSMGFERQRSRDMESARSGGDQAAQSSYAFLDAENPTLGRTAMLDPHENLRRDNDDWNPAGSVPTSNFPPTTASRAPDFRSSLSPAPPLDSSAEQASPRETSSPRNPNGSLSVRPDRPIEGPASQSLPRSFFRDQSSRGVECVPGGSGQATAHSGDFFPNATNLKFDHTTMVHGDMHQYFQDSNVLKEMKVAHVVIEAEFDSSDREYAPRCHPGTRTRFLNELNERIRSGTRVTWLFGPAGVGKSAIMQTLAETLSPSVICLSFFFSRPNKHDDLKKVLPTLAYRLATMCDTYRLYLEGHLARDPYFLAKTMAEQFKRLFIDPFATQRFDSLPGWVVFLDGLDEGDGLHAQCRLLDLIQGFVQNNQTSRTPICWVIASRPEPHLRTTFSHMEGRIPADFGKLEIPIDSDDAVQDMETYIRAEFMRVRRSFSDIIPPRWPLEADLLKVAVTSSGLFVFGTTCMAYIGDQNPVQRLKHIIDLIDHYRAKSRDSRPALPRNPFEILDILYLTILKSIPLDSLPTTRAILGFYLLDKDITGNPPLVVACEILEYDPFDAYAALRGLHSVLSCPPQDDLRTPLKFLHASFADFLKDKTRSREYWFDMARELRRVWRCHVQVFRQIRRTLLPELVSLTDEECERCIRHDALFKNHRKHNWLKILITYCHAPPCKCDVLHHLVLDDAELVDVFKEFSPVLFCPEVQLKIKLEDVVGWLFNTTKHAPPALLEHIYWHIVGLDKLTESDYDCMFRGLGSGRSAAWENRQVIPLYKLNISDLSQARYEEIKHETVSTRWRDDRVLLRDDWKLLGDLMHIGKERQTKCTVRIFGIRGDGLWAMISGRFRIGGLDSDCLVSPYVELGDVP